MFDLENNLLLFFTGFSRNSSLILNEQNTQTLKNSEIINNLDYAKELGLEIKKNLIKGNCEEFGRLMHEHWRNKLKRSKNVKFHHR